MKMGRIMRDRYLVVAVFVAAAIVSALYLFVYTGPIGVNHGLAPSWFETSVMMACGKGFTNADPSQVPALEQFLQQKQMAFLPEMLPPDLFPGFRSVFNSADS
jgi:hypothetical protein